MTKILSISADDWDTISDGLPDECESALASVHHFSARALVLDGDAVGALVRVLDYLAIDEEKHFLECDREARVSHVWNDVLTLRKIHDHF